MSKSIFLLAIVFLLFSCSSENEKEIFTLKTNKEKISYTLGADHARSIAESGDPNYSKYDIEQILKGFDIGIKDENALDESCKKTLSSLFGQTGNEFNEKYAKDGSNCIGKISGVFFTSGWKQKNALDKIDLKLVKKGFEDGLRKVDTLIPRTEQASMVQNFLMDINKVNGQLMLNKARAIKNANKTASGIVLETLENGQGGSPQNTDDILAHYILMNSFGDTLQSSFDMVEKYDQKLSPFSLLNVVPGWQEGIPMMKKNGKYKLYVPYHLAYGEQGMFNPQSQSYDIQPFESLVFYIELLDFGKSGTLTK